jgi:hypothetical protein
MGGAVSLSMSEIGSDWPIMNYIISIDEYETTYKSYLNDFTQQVFEPTKMSALYSKYEALIQEYATQETSSFSSYVNQLKEHASDRNQAVQSFLN